MCIYIHVYMCVSVQMRSWISEGAHSLLAKHRVPSHGRRAQLPARAGTCSLWFAEADAKTSGHPLSLQGVMPRVGGVGGTTRAQNLEGFQTCAQK